MCEGCEATAVDLTSMKKNSTLVIAMMAKHQEWCPTHHLWELAPHSWRSQWMNNEKHHQAFNRTQRKQHSVGRNCWAQSAIVYQQGHTLSPEACSVGLMPRSVRAMCRSYLSLSSLKVQQQSQVVIFNQRFVDLPFVCAWLCVRNWTDGLIVHPQCPSYCLCFFVLVFFFL